jgi:hypothetical protein
VNLLIIPLFSIGFMGLFIWKIMPSLNMVETRLNEIPLQRLNEWAENDPVYQHSYCRRGHPNHPCGEWFCKECEICLHLQELENRVYVAEKERNYSRGGN